jgi:hypothetical protein
LIIKIVYLNKEPMFKIQRTIAYYNWFIAADSQIKKGKSIW